MAESKVLDDKYIKIKGWMVSRLKLKGNQLLIYAIIYYFSCNREENKRYIGGLKYLADWTNSTQQGCIKCLKELLRKGLIFKEPKQIYNKAFYCINWEILDKIARKRMGNWRRLFLFLSRCTNRRNRNYNKTF